VLSTNLSWAFLAGCDLLTTLQLEFPGVDSRQSLNLFLSFIRMELHIRTLEKVTNGVVWWRRCTPLSITSLLLAGMEVEPSARKHPLK